MNSNKSQKLTIETGVESLVGRLREGNEDSYAVFAPSGDLHRKGLDGLLLVADGMGGELAGDVASRLATEAVRNWAQHLETSSFESFSEEAPSRTDEGLRHAFAAANSAVRNYGQEKPQASGLGTTLVVAALVGSSTVIAHIGDSRCYRIRDGEVEQLTVDHSWVEQQAQAGLLDRDDIESHPQSNVLTRSIGSDSNDAPDVRIDAALPGDLLVLCSDGMTGSVRSADLLEAAQLVSPQGIASHLAQLANDRDGSDNITVAVGRIELLGVTSTQHPAGTRRLNLSYVGQIAAGALLASALGFAAGTYRADLTGSNQELVRIEERATALLDVATADVANGRTVDAKKHLEQARDLFQEAPLAREAQRRLTELSRDLRTSPAAEVTTEASTEQITTESLGEVVQTSTEGGSPADPPSASAPDDAAAQDASEASASASETSATATDPSDAARAEAQAARNSGSEPN